MASAPTTRPEQLAATTSTSTTLPEQAGTAPAVLYYVQADRLVPITRALPARNAESIIESLLQPPTTAGGGAPGCPARIPGGTEMLGLERSGIAARRRPLRGVRRRGRARCRQLAIGQIVLSETGLDATPPS